MLYYLLDQLHWRIDLLACQHARGRSHGSRWQAKFKKKPSSMKRQLFWSWQLSYIKQVEVLFPIEETTVRSIRTYSKSRSSLSSRLFYKPQTQYIMNQSGSAKETFCPKIGKNIEMLVYFICVTTQNRALIHINNHHHWY